MFSPLYDVILITILLACLGFAACWKLFNKRLFPSRQFVKWWIISSLIFSLIRTVAVAYYSYQGRNHSMWSDSSFLYFIRILLSFDYALSYLPPFDKILSSLTSKILSADIEVVYQDILYFSMFFVYSLFISLSLILPLMIFVFRKDFEKKEKYKYL